MMNLQQERVGNGRAPPVCAMNPVNWRTMTYEIVTDGAGPVQGMPDKSCLLHTVAQFFACIKCFTSRIENLRQRTARLAAATRFTTAGKIPRHLAKGLAKNCAPSTGLVQPCVIW